MAQPVPAVPEHGSDPSAGDLAQRLAALESELDLLRQEHEATTEVLQAIRYSGFDLPAVLQMVVDRAGRLCAADTGNISLARDGVFVEVPAWYRPPQGSAAENRLSTISQTVRRRSIRSGDRSSLLGRVGGTLETVHIPDTEADGEYRSPFAGAQMIRTALGVPLLAKDGSLIGAMVMNRYQAQPYSLDQVQLVERFAAQAVTAIENARLYGDSERRRMQADALAQLVRAGTLKPEPQHVVSLIVPEAARLLEADYAAVTLRLAGDRFTWQGVRADRAAAWATDDLPAGSLVELANSSGRTVVAERSDDDSGFPPDFTPVEAGERRVELATPLIAHGETLGALVVGWHAEVWPGQEQLDLAEALAGYAATIIDNAETHAEVQLRAQELKRLNDELEQRVEARTAELTASYKELEGFSYTVSHDLRAPLRAMDGFSQVLLEDYGDKLDEQGRDALMRVRNASQRMGRMIDAILGLSRVARTELRRQPVNLSRQAWAVIADLRQGEPSREVDVVVAENLQAVGDPELLRLALQNLLQNAWKFTAGRHGARIEVGETEHDGRRAFYVRDNGAGFDMAYVNTLFRPFTRLHDVRQFSGDGVGLASVHRVLARHGGRVWAESAVDQGATFFFTLDSAPA